MKRRYAQIRTKNFTAEPFRRSIITSRSAIIRLGSVTPTEKAFRKPKAPGSVIEINTVNAIKNSRNKLLMKACFDKRDVPQAEWWSYDRFITSGNKIDFPIVVKRVHGFQGRGMELIENQEQLDNWLGRHPDWSSTGWYFEKFYNYAREYRLHVSKNGTFMCWRKLRTRDAENRWFFNSTNCNWVSDKHELFDKPKCWKAMEKAALDALESVGLDIGAVDIRVQSNDRDDPKFIVCEINSAPALGNIGIEKYKEELTKLIQDKNNKYV